MNQTGSATNGSHFWRRITWQLLLAVNLPLAFVLAILLALDYQREMNDALSDQQMRLTDEAMSIYRGLYYLAQNDRPDTVQKFIDSVCAHLQQSQSPGHCIAVRWSGGTLQSSVGESLSPEIMASISEGNFDSGNAAFDESRVIGRYSGHGVTVYVSELTTNIRRSIRRNIFYHLASLVILAIVAAFLVNLVLWRIVARPLRRLATAVKKVATGEYSISVERFNSVELEELASAVFSMSTTLNEAERTHHAQMAQARRIQNNLLPKVSTIPGCRVIPHFSPAEEVAGDYYDLIPSADGSWLICVADVTGHGIPAAIGAAVLKTVFVNATEHATAPGDILREVNLRLGELLPDQFVSMFVAKWNLAKHCLTYASAGHEPGILLQPNQSAGLLVATGPLLGLDENGTWETEVIEVGVGDRVILVTDGVTEAHSPHTGMLGRKNLISLLEDCSQLSVERVVSSISDALREHRAGEAATDDVTILILEIADTADCRESSTQQSPQLDCNKTP